MESNKGNKKPVKKIVIIAVVVIVLIIAAFSVHAGIVMSNDRIYSGVYVGEIDLGGMTQKQASEKISEYYKAFSNISLNFKCDEIKFDLSADSISFNADATNAAKAAYRAGRNGNFFLSGRTLAARPSAWRADQA